MHGSMAVMEDQRAAWAVVGIIIAVKLVVGVLLFFMLPVGETASLYAVVHLGAILGIVPLGLLVGGSALFWLRVLRLRARRRQLQWSEWHVEERL